jgi:hypothetical protein
LMSHVKKNRNTKGCDKLVREQRLQGNFHV